MTLEDNVRCIIGESGPQLPADEYEARIDEVLERATPADLLRWISLALEDDKTMAGSL